MSDLYDWLGNDLDEWSEKILLLFFITGVIIGIGILIDFLDPDPWKTVGIFLSGGALGSLLSGIKKEKKVN